MSNESWSSSSPPPPPGGSIPPPPPMPSAPPPPSGFQNVGGQWQQTGGLRTATIVLFWAATAATALMALALFQRRSVWDGFVDGSKSIGDLDDADGLVGAAASLQVRLTIASAIVVSIWALRAARNAQLRGGQSISPGLACGGWYIPIAWFIVPFIQLRRMTDIYGRSKTPLGMWQAFFIGQVVFNLVLRAQIDLDELDAGSDVADRLMMQGVWALGSTVCLGVAAFFAMSALRNADGA